MTDEEDRDLQPIPKINTFDIQSRELIPRKPNCSSDKGEGISASSRHGQFCQRIFDIAML